MKKMLRIVAILGLILSAAFTWAQHKMAPDEAAIRQAVQSYVEAFNRGDATAVASFWSDDGEYVTSSGDELKGRRQIEAAFQDFFSQNKGVMLQVTPSSISFPYPNRAAEWGNAVVSRPGQAPEETQYAASYVKEGGAWRLTSVREEAGSPAYRHLKDLEWLIGDWVDRDENSTVDTVYRWAKNQSFITGSFTIYVQGNVDLQGTQVIGWDPATKTIRSWVFDSQGGFGQGVWSKKGDQWVVRMSSVLSSGEKASAINSYTYVDDNTFTFRSVGREIGGEPVPDIEAVTVIRKQPESAEAGK